MKRWLLPAALAVLIVGVVLTLAGNYGRQLVHDQLAPQKITFAPYDESGQNGDNYEAYPDLRDRAGTTVTDGLAARDFATYIDAHVMETTGGRSYSEVSAAARANPEDEELQATRRVRARRAAAGGDHVEHLRLVAAGLGGLLRRHRPARGRAGPGGGGVPGRPPVRGRGSIPAPSRGPGVTRTRGRRRTPRPSPGVLLLGTAGRVCRLPPMDSIHERYERLLEAGLVLAADLSLPATLQRIVELAAGLTGARYGALGVLGRDGVITEFITTGVSDRGAGGDRPHPGRAGHPRGADRRRPAAAAARHRRGPPLGRLPAQPPADAQSSSASRSTPAAGSTATST